MKKQILLFISIILLLSCKNKRESNESADFITQDIDNFYSMLSSLENAKTYKDTIRIINQQYLKKASPGLEKYLNVERNNNNRNIEQEYYKIISSFPTYFQSQKAIFLAIKSHTKAYEKYFSKIKIAYPEANFSPIYFSIGFFNTQGRFIYPSTVYIGLEASVRTDSTDYSEFPKNYSWLQMGVANYKSLGYIVVHESLHSLQKDDPNNNSILNQAIVEGAAVFLTEYFCGKKSLVGSAGITQNMIDYAKTHQKTIWEDFREDLNHPENFSQWFWNDDSKYPNSMGYYMGYMICKDYYRNTADKKKAIKTLIEVKNPKLIFKKSKYSK